VDNQLLVSCEHGGNRIPGAYLSLFDEWSAILNSHRGHDPGALTLARELGKACHAPVIASTVSRLLIDLNRSLTNRDVWSDVTRGQPEAVRKSIVRRYYSPYRRRIKKLVSAAAVQEKRTIHVACHSFTPTLKGKTRTADIGILYDPARKGEVAFAAQWKQALEKKNPQLRVRRNYPYQGKNDGLMTPLRQCFSPDHYLGIELEINQSWVFSGPGHWDRMRDGIIQTLQQLLASFP